MKLYQIMDDNGCTRISCNLDDLPLHKDWIMIDTLQEVTKG